MVDDMTTPKLPMDRSKPIMSPASARIEKINTQIFIISVVIPLASAMGI